MSQFCARCQGVMLGDTPRAILNGKVLHIYCHWYLTTRNKPRVPPRLVNLTGEKDADTLQQEGGGGSNVRSDGNESSAINPEGSTQSTPRRLHWTSHQ